MKATAQRLQNPLASPERKALIDRLFNLLQAQHDLETDESITLH